MSITQSDEEIRDTRRFRELMAHDVHRAVVCIWWTIYPPKDALEEVTVLGRMHDINCGRLYCSTDKVVSEMLTEEYKRQLETHTATRELISAAVLTELRVGADRAQVARVAAALAKQQALLPPPYVVVDAIEEAAKDFRIGNAWWKKRAVG